MNYPQFLFTLRKLSRTGAYIPYISPYEEIRIDVPGHRHCPITAVCLYAREMYFPMGDYEQAAEQVGYESSSVSPYWITIAADEGKDKAHPGDLTRRVNRHLRYFLGLPQQPQTE